LSSEKASTTEALRAGKHAFNESETLKDEEQAIQARKQALNDWVYLETSNYQSKRTSA